LLPTCCMMAQTSKEGQLHITQPLGSCGCLWKLRMINGIYHHSHLLLHLVCHRIHLSGTDIQRIIITNHRSILLLLSSATAVTYKCQTCPQINHSCSSFIQAQVNHAQFKSHNSQVQCDGSDIQGRWSTTHHTAIGFMWLSVETANDQWNLSSQPSASTSCVSQNTLR